MALRTTVPFLLTGVLAAADGLPVMPPLFQAGGGSRVVPELRVSSFGKDGRTLLQPSLVLGNKRLGFRELSNAKNDQSASFVVDNREVLRIQFWGSGTGENWGYPFKTLDGREPRITADPATSTITFAKDYRQLDGSEATFTYTLKPAGAGQVVVAWDLGVTQERIDANPKAFAGVTPWFTAAGLQAPIAINGQVLRVEAAAGTDGKKVTLAAGEALEFAFSPEKPLERFSFTLPGGHPFEAIGTSKDGWTELFIKTNGGQVRARERMVVDFGLGAQAAPDAPPAVAGIDFWGQDRMLVPASTTRNLMPNPSFEQGLRFWGWWHGGGRFVSAPQLEYSVVGDARFGQRALLIRPGQGGMAMQSFTIPVVKGRTYTVSFHVKGDSDDAKVCVGIQSPLQGSSFTWQEAFTYLFPITREWARHATTFTPDTPAITFLIGSPVVTAIDGFQLEEGSSASEFIAPEAEGELVTADPDNNLVAGQPIEAAFVVRGRPGATGELSLSLRNFFREEVFATTSAYTLDASGSARLALPLSAQRLGTGVFVLRSDIRPAGGPAVRDSYRLSVMEFLDNRHATKDVFGNLHDITRITRGDDLGRNYMRWGFGSTTYGQGRAEAAAQLEACRITNFLSIAADAADEESRKFLEFVRHGATAVTPEMVQRIEQICFDTVKRQSWDRSWSVSTESESSPMIQAGSFDEWAKVQLACQRGVKRAKPDAIVLPDGGTSGFSRLRGYRETEGYLASTRGKVTWDSIAVHPYGNLDGVRGTNDLDVEIQRLRDLMAKHGYGAQTPIDLTEGFNYCPLQVQEWNTSCNDYYNNGKPTYDFGWQEYIQASWAARTWIMCLKHWPQVRSFNVWLSRIYLDQHLAPLAVCKIPNTLGLLLGKPVFKADVRPAAGVRGYVFEDEQGRGVAALWCTIDRVEEGLEQGPELLLRSKLPDLEYIDLMGNRRQPKLDHGAAVVPLGSAPVFIRCAKGGSATLAADLADAEVAGAASALSVTVQPNLDGSVEAVASNLTGKALKGTLRIAGEAIPLDILAKGSVVRRLGAAEPPLPGRLRSWKGDLGIEFANGRTDTSAWNMQFFYVPHAAQPLPSDPAAPAWTAVPSIPVTNWFIQGSSTGGKPVAGGQPGDLDARLQAAWDKDNLYVRVSCSDDVFVPTAANRWTKSVGGSDPQLYKNDGCVELYLDCGANGRSNTFKGFDQDDYRYDFAAGSAAAADGPGSVYRLREVFHQLAGGLDMPTKDQAAKGVQCVYRREGGRYAYVMILAQRYIEPLKLEKGWRAGLGLYIHDNDSPDRDWPGKGLSLATEPGAHCDGRPDLWPIMILAE